MTDETSQTLSPTLFDPLVKKLATTVIDQSIFIEGTSNPLGSVILRLDSPVQALVNLITPFDVATGVFANASLYNPSTGRAEVQRTPTWLNHIGPVQTAGLSPIHALTAGKKSIHLQGFSVTVDPLTATAGGSSAIQIMDGDAVVLDTVIICSATAQNAPFRAAGILPGNGILLANANLKLNIGTALSAGGIYLNAWGYED